MNAETPPFVVTLILSMNAQSTEHRVTVPSKTSNGLLPDVFFFTLHSLICTHHTHTHTVIDIVILVLKGSTSTVLVLHYHGFSGLLPLLLTAATDTYTTLAQGKPQPLTSDLYLVPTTL